MYLENGGMLILFVAGAAFLTTLFFIVRTARRRAAVHRRKQELLKQIVAERVRLEKLPKLDTRWLLNMPPAVANQWFGDFRERFARSFGTRYNRLIVFDEVGNPWVGLFMPKTLESLHEAQYLKKDYFVPFCGAGEAHQGEPLLVDGYRMDIYPIWMGNSTDIAERRLWRQFEIAFEDAFRNENYHVEAAKVLSAQWLRAVEQKKRSFGALCAELAALEEQV